ncbi:MAG: hypothetical protein JSU96_20660 [Acidobacteriota bacterium]|nr:MAG: hypothetical protein JSU96_20660 [Acidobacteriota bacterium]
MRLIIAALAMGLAWALRGHFGHEHGAAWAGAVGTLAVLIVVRRSDWNRRLPVLASLGALGWSIGGIMSYGIVVGYGRGTDFLNVLYGLAMLFVIGGLYGFLGGGFFGLGLETTSQRRPAWHSLACEMVVGAVLIWGILVYQFEWLMTPPRSELWAACLGAAMALTWFLYRNGFKRSLVLACYSGLGAGIGFSFGNFLQTLGTVSGYALNWWNLMEFTLGFCGGLGMGYAVTRTGWEESDTESKASNLIGAVFLLIVIPIVNLIQSFEWERLVSQVQRLNLPGVAEIAATQRVLGWAVLGAFLLIGMAVLWRLGAEAAGTSQAVVCVFGLIYLLEFIVFSFVRKAVYVTGFSTQPEQFIYWVFLLLLTGLVFLLFRRNPPARLAPEVLVPIRWDLSGVGIAVLLVALAWLSVNLHNGLPGAHTRF